MITLRGPLVVSAVLTLRTLGLLPPPVVAVMRTVGRTRITSSVLESPWIGHRSAIKRLQGKPCYKVGYTDSRQE